MSDEMNDQKPVTPVAPITSSEPIDLTTTTPGFLDGNPRTMFAFGLVSGMVIILLMNNFMGLPGGVGAAKATDPAAKVAVADPTAKPTAPAAGPLAPASKDDHIRGDLSKAKVVMIEYSDFECSFCAKHHPTMMQAVKEYGDKVAWIYRHLPLSFHANAIPAANASECASEQGKFWEFSDAMFANQSSLTGNAAAATTFFNKTAADLKLDISKFNKCFADSKYQSVVDAHEKSGATAGVSGTPATFINGTLVSGAVPYASLKKLIDDALAKAK